MVWDPTVGAFISVSVVGTVVGFVVGVGIGRVVDEKKAVNKTIPTLMY